MIPAFRSGKNKRKSLEKHTFTYIIHGIAVKVAESHIVTVF